MKFPSRRSHEADAFLDEIRPMVANLPQREAPGELLDRILVDRARGERMILPSVDGVGGRGRFTRRMAIAAAFLVVAGASLVLAPRRDSRSTDDVVSRSFIAVASAQEVPAAKPMAPAVAGMDGSKLHVGRLVFAQRWTDSTGRASNDATATFDVAPVSVDGRDAWRIVSTIAGNIGAYGERLEVESLFVARADLRTIRRDVHASPYSRYSRINIAQQFRGDSVLGRMRAEGADATKEGRPIAQRLPGTFAPFISEALGPLFLSTVQLSPEFRGSVSLLGWAVRPNDVYRSMTMRVTGSEWVTVPAGRFECWRLELTVGRNRVVHWARKSDGLGIRTRDETKRATFGVREFVMTHE